MAQVSSQQATDLVGAIINDMEKIAAKDTKNKTVNIDKTNENACSRPQAGTKNKNAIGNSSGVPQSSKGKGDKNKHGDAQTKTKALASKESRSSGKEREQRSSSNSSSSEIKGLRDELKSIKDMMKEVFPVVKELKLAHDAMLDQNEAYYEVDEPERHNRMPEVGDKRQAEQDELDNEVDLVLASPNKKPKVSDDLMNIETVTVTASVSEENSTNYIDEIEKEVDDNERCDPPVNEKLAKILTIIAKKGITSPREKERLKDIIPPENCPMMGKVKVNHGVWSKLSAATQNADLAHQALLENINKAMIPLTFLASKCMESIQDADNKVEPPTTGEILKTITDSLIILGNVTHKVNMKRRESIKPELRDMYKALCSPQNEITNLLLGDDLSKSAKDAKETSHVTANIIKDNFRGRGFNTSSFRGRFRGAYRARGRGYYQNNFLGRAGDSFPNRTPAWNSQRGRGNRSRPYKK